jgi:hypothetical protein
MGVAPLIHHGPITSHQKREGASEDGDLKDQWEQNFLVGSIHKYHESAFDWHPSYLSTFSILIPSLALFLAVYE